MGVIYAVERPKQKVKYTKGILTATRQILYKVQHGDGPGVFVGDPNVPAEGSSHPDFPGAFCIELDFDQHNPAFWTGFFRYSSEREMAENPIDDPVQVTWTGEIYTDSIFRDRSGNAIVNSAGDYFIDPSPTREKTHLIAKVVASVATVPTWVITYRDVINDGPIVIDGLPIDTGLAMIRRPEISSPKKRGDTSYREISFDVHIHPDGWNLKPLDAGFRQLVDGDLVQITNAGDDEEPTTPVPLDGSGAALATPTPETAVFLDFEIYEPKDFTALPGIT